MSIITGDQLALIQKAFDLAASQMAGATNLDDGDVSQVLTVNEFVRRSTVQNVNCGWWQGTLQNVHSGADTENSTINPYAPGADAFAPFPGVVPEGIDVWLCGITGARSSGVGGLVSGIASINPAPSSASWGRDDSGDPLASGGPRMVLAVFDNIVDTSLSQDPMETQAGLTYQPVGIRIPRDSTISFHSTSAAAAEFQMSFLLAVHPAAMGQDVVT